ncbi:MAG: poly-gamma-glutamate synthase PgsB [Acidobacteriota bacterium]|nr:poly-gamma-glutamate synthase PgsB [Acidobacteriota bacterium]
MNKVLILSLLFFLIYLGFESLIHYRRLRKIPHRIAVTGIRGKSSITRIITASLRQAGYRVVAKTTGSRPVIIYPDGHEEEIKRRGKPTILEQKRLIRKAARQRVDYLVAEMMSIQPECLRAESRYLLQPEILVVSNIRPDHLAVLGKTREEIALAFTRAFRTGQAVYLPEEELLPEMLKEAKGKGTVIIPVKEDSASQELAVGLPYPEFEPNSRLAVSVLRFCRLSDDIITQGMKRVEPDAGCPRAWEVNPEDTVRKIYFVSLFAANDPLSSIQAMQKVIERTGWWKQPVYGLLSFRRDRGDRTKQWVDFLADNWRGKVITDSMTGGQLKLSGLALAGPGAIAARRYLRKKLKSLSVEAFYAKKNPAPETVLKEILTHFSFISSDESSPFRPEPVVFGLGNIAGFGQEMIDYLERKGNAIRL